ncbi:MAG: hypothetical protein R3C56_01215 [Pirellulaceae bacterium]
MGYTGGDHRYAGDRCIVGLLNGGCVLWLKMPPFIVTLTVMMFVSGLAIWSTQSQSISDLPHSLLVFGKNAWLAGGITLTVGVGVQFLLSRSHAEVVCGRLATTHKPRWQPVSM